MSEKIFNLDDGSLLGYHLGVMCPSEFSGESYEKRDLGFAIHIFNNRISSILVCFRPGYRDFNSYTGVVLADGKKCFLGIETTLEDICSMFGSPYESWDDGVEMCAMFRRRDFRVEVIWNVEDQASMDYIAIEPLL